MCLPAVNTPRSIDGAMYIAGAAEKHVSLVVVEALLTDLIPLRLWSYKRPQNNFSILQRTTMACPELFAGLSAVAMTTTYTE